MITYGLKSACSSEYYNSISSLNFKVSYVFIIFWIGWARWYSFQLLIQHQFFCFLIARRKRYKISCTHFIISWDARMYDKIGTGNTLPDLGMSDYYLKKKSIFQKFIFFLFFPCIMIHRSTIRFSYPLTWLFEVSYCFFFESINDLKW